MLLSPGHSPRRVSSPERDPPASETGSRLRAAKVLDEDSYVAAIERIIERDFFPDIPKLRDRLDWLDAVKTGDPLQIRDAQLKIIERRRGAAAAAAGEKSDRRTQTPGSTFARNFTPFDEPAARPAPGEGAEEVPSGGGVEASLSLDEFFRRYTSEDNESFSKILEKVNRKRKERFGYLTEGEKGNEECVPSIGDAKRDRITDGFGTSDQPPSTLDSWNFTAKNLLMYHPADRGEAPLTTDERALRLKALEKEISRPNTRFHGKSADSRPSDEASVEILYAPVAGSTPAPAGRPGDKAKKYDLDDLRKTPNPLPDSNGYSFVRTPSPAPGADGSPFVTWGEIEGTPLRLDDDDYEGGTGGPRYNVPRAPARDEKAHSLSREAARRLRERSGMFKKPPLPSPARARARAGSASPGARTLSPAAQKFVRNAIAKSSPDFDETLRASYRGASPVAGTPKSVSRLGRGEAARTSRSPSVGEGSNLPW